MQYGLWERIMGSVWVLVERNSGGAEIKGVFASAEDAGLLHSFAGWTLVHEATHHREWKHPSLGFRILVERIVESAPKEAA